ncbi:hypothetical protein P9112_009546 [Eukaryota sp. TZLM1-RC]
MISLASHFTALQSAINEEDFDSILQHCNDILNISPSDVDALCVKAVFHILEGDINDALSLFSTYPVLKQALPIEHAYCLYRNNANDQALAVLDSLPDSVSNDESLQDCISFLYSQILYRQRLYDKASQHLTSVPDFTDDPEILTNIYATHSLLGSRPESLRHNHHPQLSSEVMTWQLLFNLGVYECSTGTPSTGNIHLKEALQKAIDQEVGNKLISQIRIELGISFLLIDDKNAAEDCFSQALQALKGQKDDVIGQKSKEVFGGPLSALANGNRVVCKGLGSDFFRLTKWTRKYQTDGLLLNQSLGLQSNHVILLLKLAKYKEARNLIESSIKTIEAEDQNNRNMTYLFERFVALLAWSFELEKKYSKVCEILEQFCEKNANIGFVYAHFLVSRGYYNEAAQHLKSLFQNRQLMTNDDVLIKCLIALSDLGDFLEDFDQLESIFDEIPSNNVVLFAKAQYLVNRASRLLTKGEITSSERYANEAVAVLNKYVSGQQSKSIDNLYLKGLVLKAQSMSSVADVDTMNDSFEMLKQLLPKEEVGVSIAEHLPSDKLPLAVDTAITQPINKKKSKKKKKKTKVPDSVPPEEVGKPDPNRWLSLKQRSIKKVRGKGKEKAMGFGHQGGEVLGAGEVSLPAKQVSAGKVVQSNNKPKRQKGKMKKKKR